jgi:hypothetical protein
MQASDPSWGTDIDLRGFAVATVDVGTKILRSQTGFTSVLS